MISGEHYLIGFYKRIDFYSTSTASIDFTIALNGRSNDVVFVDDVTFAVAGEMPQVSFSSMFYEQLLPEDPKSAKKTDNYTFFFALS